MGGFQLDLSTYFYAFEKQFFKIFFKSKSDDKITEL